MRDTRRRRIIRARGFSHVGTTLEAAAIMGWFVVLVLGEKFLNDAATARRSAEGAVQQTVVSTATSYCQGGALAAQDVGGPTAHGGAQSVTNGALSVGDLLSLFKGLGFGQQPTFSLYSDPLQATTVNGQTTGVRPHPLVGSGSHDFKAIRSLACLEKPKDSPKPSLEPYRTTIFDLNIRGYNP